MEIESIKSSTENERVNEEATNAQKDEGPKVNAQGERIVEDPMEVPQNEKDSSEGKEIEKMTAEDNLSKTAQRDEEQRKAEIEIKSAEDTLEVISQKYGKDQALEYLEAQIPKPSTPPSEPTLSPEQIAKEKYPNLSERRGEERRRVIEYL